MRWSIINTIFKKELKEILRDKRTLYLVILMPFFLYPVLFAIIGKTSSSQIEKINQQEVTVLLNEAVKASPVYKLLKRDKTLILQEQDFTKAQLDTMSNTIGIKVLNDPSAAMAATQPIQLEIYANATKDLLDSRSKRIQASIESVNKVLVKQRLAEKELPVDFINPIQVKEINIAPATAQVGKMIGRFIPMMLAFFIFLGVIYPSIDITAGEKERQTLQTLFVSPIKVQEIMGGKFLAVFVIGIVSAIMNLLSLILAMYIQVKLMGATDAFSGFSLAIGVQAWIWLLILILLTTIFIAGLCLAVIALANSYKESQSYVTPLMMVIMIPAMIMVQPGMELTATTALIPIVNIFLAMGAVMMGSFNTGLVALVALMALIYAVFALAFASFIFGNENVITGQKVDFKQLFSR